MDKFEATVVMINELEELFKQQYNNKSDNDVFMTSVITMIFDTINKSIEQLNNNY